MRIKKISIKNYRSCIETVFEPDEHLSALIGPNGSGKTNILSALKLLTSLCSNRGRSILSNTRIASTSEIKTWYELDGKQIIHTARLNIVADEKNQDEILDASETWYMFDFTGRKNKIDIPCWLVLDLTSRHGGALHPSLIKSSGLIAYLNDNGVSLKELEYLGAAVSVISKITYYSASQFTNPATCPISFEAESDNRRTPGQSTSGHKQFLNEMYQAKKRNDPSYAEFIEIIGPHSIGLVEQIEFKEVITSTSSYSVAIGGQVKKSEKNNLLIIPSFKISGNKLSPSQLSEGTFKTLALIFYLVTDKSPVLMLEEPEVCVHYGLLCSIVELIKLYSSNKQILISTHSDAVLNQLEINNIFSVKREKNNGTTVSSIKKSLKGADLLALKDYLNNEGNLGDYWRSGDLENV